MMQQKNIHFSPVFWAILTLTCFSCVSAEKTSVSKTTDTRTYITVAKVGGDYLTIQEAVNNASEGQTIKIHGGTYREAVTIAKTGLVLEAFDPVGEPVIIDGADPVLLEAALAWEPVADGVYRTGYVGRSRFRMIPCTHAGVVQACCSRFMKIGPLLRGYRDPYDERYYQDKKLVFFTGDTFGLAGPYCEVAQLDPAFRRLASTWSEQSGFRETGGRFYYDAIAKQLYIAPASGGDPAGNRYEIPVLSNLVYLAASGITLRNLIFEHSAGYAVYSDQAEGGRVEGCVFKNAHFAVAIRDTSNFPVTGNYIEEIGFYDRYSRLDASGTMYEKSSLAVEESGAVALGAPGDGIVIAGNIINGTPFFIPWTSAKLTVRDNLAAFSIFGLFPAARAPWRPGQVSRVK